MIKLPKHMPHLNGAMGLTGPKGLCFHRAAGLVLDLPPATLAVGTLPAATSGELDFNPEASTIDFIHAWVEAGDWVLAPTLIERSLSEEIPWIVPREAYYQANKPRNIRRMRRARLKHLSVEYGLAQHLLRFTPLKHGAKFGDVILNELAIKFVVTSRGGVIPAPMERE